ncbi:MAG TPA: hypothetical protein PK156_48350 [Polyangium sp.]|nr:hypothetical protein [Polyangium sp.]
MRWKTYGPFAGVLVYYVLTFVFTTIAERNFNEQMNRDVGDFGASFANASSDKERAQALRTVLLDTKHNTSSLVTSTTHAITASMMFMFILVLSWARMRTDGEKGGSAEKDRGPKDVDGNKA